MKTGDTSAMRSLDNYSDGLLRWADLPFNKPNAELLTDGSTSLRLIPRGSSCTRLTGQSLQLTAVMRHSHNPTNPFIKLYGQNCYWNGGKLPKSCIPFSLFSSASFPLI
jgi:hypothetical protein